jgi:hypothetical protein
VREFFLDATGVKVAAQGPKIPTNIHEMSWLRRELKEIAAKMLKPFGSRWKVRRTSSY